MAQPFEVPRGPTEKVVLVPVDFGQASLRAIQVAGSHASATGDALVLVHVHEPAPRGFVTLSPELGGPADRRARLRAREWLERLARPWNGTALMRDGAAVETILAAAHEVGARRIAIGRHGVRGVEHLLLGSVAEGVLRGSDVPVVVVGGNAVAEQAPGPGVPSPRPVLCAVDFDHGGPVVEAAADYAREHGTTLELAHVYQVPVIGIGGVEPLVVHGLDAALHRAAEVELARLAHRYGAKRSRLRRGHIGSEMLALLDAVQPMALVIGSHGRRRTPRAALGGVADWLLRRSPAPVLVNRYQHAPAVAAARTAATVAGTRVAGVRSMLDHAPTVGPIERFMVEDHARLDRLLAAATANLDIDMDAFARFRHDLLRHIAMEEKVLLPYARLRRGGAPLDVAAQLRADHGSIAKLLVRAPTAATVDALRELLARHNAIEEGQSGLYAACDALAREEATSVVTRLREQPGVPVAKYYDGPIHWSN